MMNSGQLAQEFSAGVEGNNGDFLSRLQTVCNNFEAKAQGAGMDIQAEAHLYSPVFQPKAHIRVTKQGVPYTFDILEEGNYLKIAYASKEDPYAGGERIYGGIDKVAQRLNTMLEDKVLTSTERERLLNRAAASLLCVERK